jgi:hypothetical protein
MIGANLVAVGRLVLLQTTNRGQFLLTSNLFPYSLVTYSRVIYLLNLLKSLSVRKLLKLGDLLMSLKIRSLLKWPLSWHNTDLLNLSMSLILS